MGGDISKSATLFYLPNNSSVGIHLTASGGIKVCNSNSSRKLPRSCEKTYMLHKSIRVTTRDHRLEHKNYSPTTRYGLYSPRKALAYSLHMYGEPILVSHSLTPLLSIVLRFH